MYESASEFSPGAGGAIGLYANGLRVLRDLSNQHPLLTSLLDDVRTAVSTLKITIGKLIYILYYYCTNTNNDNTSLFNTTRAFHGNKNTGMRLHLSSMDAS